MSKERPTILIFSTAYLPHLGGAELAIAEITQRLPEYDFLLITTRLNATDAKRERIGNVEVFRLGSGNLGFWDKLLSPFAGAFLARKLMKEHRVVLFWSVMVSFTSGAPFLLKLLLLNKKTPILLTLQEGDSPAHLKYSNFGLTGVSWFFALRLADRIQAISKFLADYARERGARCPIDIVPNGVDLEKFRPKADEPNEKFTIITTSRLSYKNGVDILIRAAQKLKNLLPEQKFEIQMLGIGEEEQKLKALMQELSVENEVKFTGSINPESIPQHLQKADIFVRPSRSEGLGNSFLEAMAVGLPVIGTQVGGIPDFLKDDETGLFAKVNDPKDLAEKIAELYRNPELRARLSQNGRHLIEEKYSWDSVARKIVQTIKNLI